LSSIPPFSLMLGLSAGLRDTSYAMGTSTGSAERRREALEAAIEGVIGHGQRNPRPARASCAEALAGRDGHAPVREERRGRDAVGQPEPGEERPLRAGADRGCDAVAARLVASPTLLDRGLRAVERGNAGLLDRPEDARS